MKLRFGLSVTIAVLGLVVGSHAQSEEAGEGIYELGEVVVSEPGNEAEAVGTVLTLSSREIQNSGARTLDEAIALIPGLYVRTGGEGTPRVDIRGFRTRHVQLLLDGIPVNDTYDGQFDPTTIPVAYIAKIKLTTGGGSVLYGPGGNGGVVNIITKKGQEKVRGSINGEARQGDTYLGRVTFSYAGEKGDVFVSGSPYQRDGYRLADGFAATKDEDGGMRDNSDRKRNNVFANFGYAPSEKALFGLTFHYVQGENGAPSVTNYDKNDAFTKKPKYDRLSDLKGYAAQMAGRYDFSQPLSLKCWAYLNRLELEENRYDDATYATQDKNGASRTESATQVAGANAQLRYSFAGRGTATLGLGLAHDTWDATGFSVGKKDNKVNLDEARDLQIYNTALQYSVSSKEGPGLVLGYGFHFQNREGEGEGDFSYLVGARYHREKTRLRASHARKVRFPSIRQLYDASAGNTDLNAERSLHYEVGVTQEFAGGMSASATGFVIDSDGFIEKEGDDIYRNYEAYRLQGVELAVAGKPVEGLRLRASYSYLNTKDKSPGSEKQELQHRPGDKVALSGTYRLSFGLTAHASLLHIADLYFYDSDGDPPLEKKALNDYTVVDVRLGQDLLKRRLEAYVGADNLFDENYEQSYGLPQSGRMVYGGLSLRF